MKSDLRIMVSFVKYHALSSIRKILHNWGLENLCLRKWMYGLPIAVAVWLSLVYGIGYLLPGLIDLPFRSWLAFWLNLALIEQLLWTLHFFNANKRYFYSDHRVILLQHRHMRILRLFSVVLVKTCLKTLVVWYGLITPLLLGLDRFFRAPVHAGWLLLAGVGYGLLNVVLVALFSLVPFVLARTWGMLSHSRVLKRVYLAFGLIIPFFLGYGISTFAIGGNIGEWIETVSNSRLGQFFHAYSPYRFAVEGSFAVVPVLCILSLLAFVLFRFWMALLHRVDLIPYFPLNSKSYRAGIHLREQNGQDRIRRALYRKDVLLLQRIDDVLLGHFGNMLYLLAFAFGFGLPFLNRLDRVPLETVIPPLSVLLASLWFQLAGDALKTALAVDRESFNLHLFRPVFHRVDGVVGEKWKVYSRFTLAVSFLAALVFLALAPQRPLLAFYVLLAFLCTGGLYSLIQLAATALYPRPNWEFEHEIGESSKAKTYVNVYTMFAFVVLLQITSVASFLTTRPQYPDAWVLVISLFLIVLFTLANFVAIMLVLRRIHLAERFVNHDQNQQPDQTI